MSVETFINTLTHTPEAVSFNDTMALINRHFDYTPTCFTNGAGNVQAINKAGSNEGSCKIFALGKLLQLNEAQTLHCFGDYYRIDVLQHPEGNDHANIRNFMLHGWAGIKFDNVALSAKD